jgi:hypothetical protein
MKRTLFFFAVVSFALSALATHCLAQTAPLPYGTLYGNLSTFSSANCTGGGWVPGMQCATGTMQCDPSLYADNLGFTIGYATPASPTGTVVAFNGGNGTAPGSAVSHEVDTLQYYLANGLEVVQVAWNSPGWETSRISFPPDTYGNVLNAACRPAGILHLVRNTPLLFPSGGAMCAQGFSAGSAAVAYTLSWYGAGWGPTGYIDNVELISGPIASRFDEGCEVPVAPNINVCQGSPTCSFPPGGQPWSVTPEFVDNFENYPRTWSNIAACANNSGGNTSIYNGAWYGMSILNPNVTTQQLSFPSTSMHAWLCASVDGNVEPMNNSSSQGWLFYQQTSWKSAPTPLVNAVANCDHPEGVYGTNATAYDGIPGHPIVLIEQDMFNNCRPHH